MEGKMIYPIATTREVSYYAMLYGEGAFARLPWGHALFDCVIFPPTGKDPAGMEALINALPYIQIEWVYTTGVDAEYWHDRVDQVSVEKGFQSELGGGYPMTAWFSEIKSIDDWRADACLGDAGHLVLILMDPDAEIERKIEKVKNKITRAARDGYPALSR